MAKQEYSDLGGKFMRIMDRERELCKKRDEGTLTDLEEAELNLSFALNRQAAFASIAALRNWPGTGASSK